MWQAGFLEMENDVGDIPEPLIEQRADPCIYRHTDGYYYFTASVPQYDRVELRRAKTIEGLASAQTRSVWRKGAGGPCPELIRAPEIHFSGGAWYVYFAAAPSREPRGRLSRHRIYAIRNASANPLAGEWEFMGQVDTGNDTSCLDAATFTHKGQLYGLWAQQHGGADGSANLYIAPMATPWQVGGAPVMLSRPEFDWECRGLPVNEAPSVLKKHGRVFIGYSAGATGHDQAMGLLWAGEDADLLDPASWTKSREPVLQAGDGHATHGPGHTGFTVAEDGSTVLLVYHARTYTEIDGDPLWNPDRHTFVKPLRWCDDGMPDFGRPAVA
ncbi:glycosyl hydrolase [Pseudoduganella albidiflava]|uniref:Glycosyl hydrolase n=2 Tax=Pseudoduganella albidiflava TaxID=321983 RepID=A0AA87Y0Y9_9BURK|nr:glycosyl hydrolase [Pseudoduganella albidiflava]